MSKPIYIIPLNDPLVKKYVQFFKQIIPGDKGSIYFDIESEVVENGRVIYFKNMVKALQHFPKLFPRFVFNMNFNFLINNDSQAIIPPALWHHRQIYQDWFTKLGNGSFMVFFMNNYQNRLFCLRSPKDPFDLIKPEIKPSATLMESENDNALQSRIFYNCMLFYIYCFGSPYNSQPAIETLLTEFNQRVTFYEIKNKALKNIRGGKGFNVTKL